MEEDKKTSDKYNKQFIKRLAVILVGSLKVLA